VFGDARHERAEFRLVERSARLERVGADSIEGNLELAT
jgi:hypothetical protein